MFRAHRAFSIIGLWSLCALAVAGTSQEKFHQAYYLEDAKHDYTAAAKLYDEVAADSGVDAKIRSEARVRAAGCREEIAAADFAKLMPPNALFYAELNRPGDQVMRLVEQLGFMPKGDKVGGPDGRQIALSPALVKAFLGVRGVAAAVTGFDVQHGKPNGVAIVHPGDMEVIRGLVETALPAAAEPVEPIDNCAAYSIDNEVIIALTSRLIIVSPSRNEIEGVIERLRGEDSESLATSGLLTSAMKQRDDALLFFCLNFEPILPLLKTGMAVGAGQQKELAIAQAILDLDSLRSLVGRAGVTNDGIAFDLALTLKEGHHNLAFNFLRLPALDKNALTLVPAGSLGFCALAVNETGSQYTAPKAEKGETPPISFMDFGREIFANIITLSTFVIPVEDFTVDGQKLPGPAVVMTVHDIAKSRALWSQMLGIASLASGASNTLEPPVAKVDGVEVARFDLPEGIALYLATQDGRLILSPSRQALSSSLATIHGGKNVLQDEAFSKCLNRLSPDSTLGAFVHVGRVAQFARQFMDKDDLREGGEFLDALTDTAASISMLHSDTQFQFSLTLTGLPNLAPALSKVIARERKIHRATETTSATPETREFVKQMLQERPDDRRLLRAKFETAAAQSDTAEADEALKAIERQIDNNARELNDFAWRLLTEERYAGRFNQAALRMSLRCNELTQDQNWMYVDTLALARFLVGEVETAITLERRALDLCEDRGRRDELEAALQRFETARDAKRTDITG